MTMMMIQTWATAHTAPARIGLNTLYGPVNVVNWRRC